MCGDQTSKSQLILFILKSNQICELLQCRYTSMFLSICWKLTVVLLYSKLTYTYRLKRLQGLNVNFTCIMYLTYVQAQLNYACTIKQQLTTPLPIFLKTTTEIKQKWNQFLKLFSCISLYHIFNVHCWLNFYPIKLCKCCCTQNV